MSGSRDDGAPRGRKHFAFWNPAPLDGMGTSGASANVEAARHPRVAHGARRAGDRLHQVAGRGRAGLPLRARAARPRSIRSSPSGCAAYRGGYLPRERREIERRLFAGELAGVVATNALELGIDVGGLDAAVLVGFPPTLASAWQQIGRAGRGRRESWRSSSPTTIRSTST